MASSSEIPRQHGQEREALVHQQSISLKTQTIFDRFPGSVVRGEETMHLFIGNSALKARGKDGIFSEVQINQKGEINGNERVQTLSILFHPGRDIRVELTQEGTGNPAITLEYDTVDQMGNVSVVDNAVIRSLYKGHGEDRGKDDQSSDGLSMYSLSEKSFVYLSGIELTIYEDEQKNELIVIDDPYTEGRVRFPIRSLNIYDSLHSFEDNVQTGEDTGVLIYE
jgi:hypothetical protein